jgi:formiminoglutamase
MIEAIHHFFNQGKDNGLLNASNQDGFLGSQLFPPSDLNELLKSKVAIIGIDETRNAFPSPYSSNANQVRYWLYQLSNIPHLKIADLGNLILGNTVNDTYAALSNIIEDLTSNNIIVVLIGGSQDLTLPIIKTIQKNNQSVDYAIIDPRFDILISKDINSGSFIREVFKKQLKGNIIGYQSYFVSDEQYNLLNDQGFDLVRIGNLRSQMNEIEPLFRDCDVTSFDLSSIRQSDCPSSTNPSPNGLYTEEACQLANFAGLSDKMCVFGTFNLVSEGTQPGLSSHLAAQIIWHFLFGISQRKGDYPACTLDNYKKIYVKIDRLDFDLIFYQNQQNKRYWVEIPINKKELKKVISCSENDYLSLCNNEIPDRIWRNIRNSMD